MELINRSIELTPIKLLDMKTKKVWLEKNKGEKQNKPVSKKKQVKYTKNLVISEFKKFGGHFVYFPAYKDDDCASEGYLLAAAEENEQFIYYFLDKNRNIQKVSATRILEFKAIPSEFFVIKWLTENKNEDLYNVVKDYFNEKTLLTPVYFKLNKTNLEDKTKKNYKNNK